MEYRYLFTNEKDTITDFLKKTIDMKFSCHTPHFDYDFNDGLRIKFKESDVTYRLIILDKTTRNPLYEQDIKTEDGVIYSFPKKYYIEYEAILLRVMDDDLYDSFPLSVITYDCSNKDILFLLANDERAGLGDCIAWMTAVYNFKLKHPTTNIFVCTQYDDLNKLFKEKYDCFTFLNYEECFERTFYATYLVGCFFNDPLRLWCPRDYKTMSLVEIGCSILGLDNDIIPLDLSLEYESSKPYVCISTHASAIYKEWIYKNGWEKIVEYLNSIDYDVYVIDAEASNRQGNLTETNIPKNAIDKTGRISLVERAKFISGADFLIGVSSGLSWLGWACGVPVVLISGFTNPITEFKTPYRVFHDGVCNSCWNDPHIEWNMNETVCPRKKNPFAMDYLECSGKIGVYAVIKAINEIPIVRERMKTC